jgi:hypothetical protein
MFRRQLSGDWHHRERNLHMTREPTALTVQQLGNRQHVRPRFERLCADDRDAPALAQFDRVPDRFATAGQADGSDLASMGRLAFSSIADCGCRTSPAAMLKLTSTCMDSGIARLPPRRSNGDASVGLRGGNVKWAALTASTVFTMIQ